MSDEQTELRLECHFLKRLSRVRANQSNALAAATECCSSSGGTERIRHAMKFTPRNRFAADEPGNGCGVLLHKRSQRRISFVNGQCQAPNDIWCVSPTGLVGTACRGIFDANSESEWADYVDGNRVDFRSDEFC